VKNSFRYAEDEEILHMTLDTVQREADKWTAMERWPMIIDALMDRLPNVTGSLQRRWVKVLQDLERKGRLSRDDAGEVATIAEEIKVCPKPGLS
jgi:mediator of RNA polymerase II transcription subunit 12